MTAAAGTPMAEIEARLADNRQQLAFEPADYGALLGGEPGRGTIGGVLACNLSGPRRIKAGAARDHFLGVQAVTGRGELIKAGGRVVKNVTGYDLCKLLAGSFGTLAVMTEVSVKVLPAAEETLTLLLAGLEPADGLGALRAAMASAYDVSGCGLPARGGGGALHGAVGGRNRRRRPAPRGPRPVASPSRRCAEGPAAPARRRGRRARYASARRRSGARCATSRRCRLRACSGGSRRRRALALRCSRRWRRLHPQWLADWAGGLIWLALGRRCGRPCRRRCRRDPQRAGGAWRPRDVDPRRCRTTC